MIKMKWLFIIVLILASRTARSQELSPRAEVSVLTFGPATEVYAIWGHTAIRVKDPATRMDKVYNYGTFDFNTPNFTLKFIKGKLNYALSIQRYYRVIKAYKEEKRWIKEQVLNLSFEERKSLYALLEENYQEENRYYKYDFLFDNCATRPLEIIEKSMIDSIDFQQELALTYRDILDEHLIHNPWMDFGIDLIIGSLADAQASARQQMFMPAYIYYYFKNGIRLAEDQQPLVAKENTIATQGDIAWMKVPKLLWPFSIFLILIILEVTLFAWSLKREIRWLKIYDNFWFTAISLGSALILFLWFGTDHIPTKYNWNVFWMNPLFLFLLPYMPKDPKRLVAKILFLILIAFLLLWFLIPQQFHLAVLPMIGVLGIKTYRYGFLKRP